MRRMSWPGSQSRSYGCLHKYLCESQEIDNTMLPFTPHTENQTPLLSAYRYVKVSQKQTFHRNSSQSDWRLGRGHYFLYTIFLLTTLLTTLPQTTFAGSCSTKECHGNMTEHRYMHSPAEEGECLECHTNLSGSQTATAPDPIHPTAKGAEFTLKSQGESLCLQCHDSMADKYEHGPAASGACTVCHSPHGSNQEAFLHAPLQKLCLSCHGDFAAAMNKAVFIHSAINDLDCSACHQPHSSGFAYLLKGETSASCFECHNDIEEKYKRSLHKHDPLYSENQCANCHFAHYSNYPALLKWDGNDTCFHCHSTTGSRKKSPQATAAQIDISDKEFIHEPIEDTGCSACHDAHGSKYGSLLTGSYPSTFYAGFKKDTYDLCFQCHDKDLLAERNRTTDFRNGSENLHNVHVANLLKGRTCKACHNLHASDGEKLINPDGIPFSDWNIPIRFEATDTGGSCMPGCHRTMKYDRKKKVDNSKEAAEQEALEAEKILENGPSDDDAVLQPTPITKYRKPITHNRKSITA
jgi:predicted CXXCH cytochrome family protein